MNGDGRQPQGNCGPSAALPTSAFPAIAFSFLMWLHQRFRVRLVKCEGFDGHHLFFFVISILLIPVSAALRSQACCVEMA